MNDLVRTQLKNLRSSSILFDVLVYLMMFLNGFTLHSSKSHLEGLVILFFFVFIASKKYTDYKLFALKVELLESQAEKEKIKLTE
jgi:hypothetical protein